LIRILTTRRRVVVALAAFVVLVVLNRARTASASLSLGDATVRASGPVTSGAQIEISASADQADTGGFAALAPPVHIEVRDGELSGPATLEFALAKPLPEGAVAVVATRTKDAGWRMAAGDYDQGRRTITVEVTHFSDWMPGAIDRQQIQRDSRRSSGSKRVRLAHGSAGRWSGAHLRLRALAQARWSRSSSTTQRS